MTSENFFFNGINGATGEYLVPPASLQQLAALARRAGNDREVIDSVDPGQLNQTGWGIIYPRGLDPAIRSALAPLVEHRRAQGPVRLLEYLPRDSRLAFLNRYGAGPGLVDPAKVPYYLLIVGDPESVPFSFQYQLDLQHAVGRLHFDTPEEYARYAESVVAAETSRSPKPRRAVLFGVKNPGDPATQGSAEDFIAPLAERLAGQTGWSVESLLEKEATKERLGRLLGGEETPALLLTASHGMGFPLGDPRQLAHQGALLCQDWPGPEGWQGPISTDHYFAADDVGDDARLQGLVTFHFACYGAGTPRMDLYAQGYPEQIAPSDFVARLPQRLLSHPAGGALAVVGHVEKAYGYSFRWRPAGPQVQCFESFFRRLMTGQTVGRAMESFGQRYAELAAEVIELRRQAPEDEESLANLWIAMNDARGYVVLGDPAVRVVDVALD
jgi:hypothetical protein